MAEAVTIPTPANGTASAPPVQVPVTATPPIAQPTPVPQGQPQPDTFNYGGIDPNQLSPAQRELHKQMVANMTRQSQEWADQKKDYDGRLSKLSDYEKQFAEQKTQLERVQQALRQYETWRPLIDAANQPGKLEAIQAILSGQQQRQPQAQAPQLTPQQTAQRLMQGIGDDDYITGAMLEQALPTLLEQRQQAMQAQWRQDFDQLGQNAMQQIMNYLQQYLSLADQGLTLRLSKQYNLQPQGDFSLNDVINTAMQYKLQDLNAAYDLRYGEDNMRRAVEAEKQRQTALLEQQVKEAYERGIREAQLQAQQQPPGMFPIGQPVNLPKFSAGAKIGYSAGEEAVRQEMARRGFR